MDSRTANNLFESMMNVGNQLNVYNQMLINRPDTHTRILRRVAELRTEYIVLSHWAGNYSPTYCPTPNDL